MFYYANAYINSAFQVGVRPLVELPGVGRNLHDHVGLLIEYQLQRPNRHYVNVDTVEEYLQYRSGILTLSGKKPSPSQNVRHSDILCNF